MFNGQNSVLWNNLRKTYKNELQSMYQTLRSTGALSYEKVERIFEEHQARWPEAIFNEDAYFKYLVPLIENGTTAYLAMAQGSKAEQRKWWLYNRFKYIDSKYNAGDAQSDVITLRGYAKSNMTVTPYADIYVSVKWGSYLQQTRGTRNVETLMACPLDNVNDTEIMVYSASQVASIGDVSGLKVGYADFSKAPKLQSVKLGSASSSYRNANDMSLSFGNNTLLKTVDIRNCTGLTSAVDLSGCVNLESAYFDGTNVPGVTLPNGGVLSVLHLPITVVSLIIRNQPALTEFVLQNYSNVTTLWLENVGSGVNARAILNSIATGSRVRLFNFTWSASDTSDVTSILDRLDLMRGLYQNGDTAPTAQVYGVIHVPSISSAFIIACQARYRDISYTYDHITAVITYYQDTGEYISEETVTDGATPVNIPVIAMRQDERYNYRFKGWGRSPTGEVDDEIFNNVVEDLSAYALYEVDSERTFTVRFYNGNTLLQSYTNLAYGASVSYSGSTPTYNGEGIADYYHFTGWSEDTSSVHDDLDVYAVFTFRALYREILEASAVDIEVSMPSTISGNAFTNFENLEKLVINGLTGGYQIISSNPKLKYVKLTNFTTQNTFMQNCPAIEKVILPAYTGTYNGLITGSPVKELRIPRSTRYNDTSYLNTSLEILDLTGSTGLTASQFTTLEKLKYLIIRYSGVIAASSYNGFIFHVSSPIRNGTGLILVPRSQVADYSQATGWMNHRSVIVAMEDYPDIVNYE